MAQPALATPLLVEVRPRAAVPPATFRFTSLALTGSESVARGRSLTALGSLLIHGILLAVVVLVPLLSDEIPPAADRALRAFFVTPAGAAPPPPPPPPPPAASSTSARAKAPALVRPPQPGRFTAPIEIPDRLTQEPSLDFGVEGGVPGGVEGGVPGGVIGGIVGGLPREAPAPPPAPVVRIGGKLVAPKRVQGVAPAYPELAVQSGISGHAVVDAHVDVNGRVKSARFVSGNPLFEQAALDAVRQWRYQPLLLNGVPCEFMLVVTMNFNLERR
ncbi:MAG TPA: energy transducer TonB [Vicinamibacteria bacterium]|nr:energy transducer TonB [Vicinamibacteria bacterium]